MQKPVVSTQKSQLCLSKVALINAQFLNIHP